MNALEVMNGGQPSGVVPIRQNAVTPMEMLQTAVANGAGLEMIEKLMALQERWQANQSRMAFNEAISAARAEMPVISKNRVVDFTSSKGRTHYQYEDLAEVARVVSPILARHGLSYRFRTTSTPNEPVTVTCIVSHRDGYSEENTLCAGRDESGNKNSIQAIGSTLTYLQRMTLKAALGLAAAADDDGKSSNSGEVEKISDEQYDALDALLSPERLPRFLTHYGIETLGDLPAAKFAGAKAALEKSKGAK